ncbi:terpene synthase family protein [Actinomadura livida]|uniref:Terpene synthase n=1 Tax=Actinomadura livida TaxID=79909 RepID=A0A7W7IJZ0_9ACTN|nr:MULTISPECIES: terpene synthase family protein [Actinomadura]MBB4778321.1 hypothetical protein [Actinomadura catellatispora]GGU25350.1 hypothetical protein GCM10010208_57910 [Actinomadura livida]
MTAADAETDPIRAAAEQGRICALATHCARDLQERAAAHPDLFDAKPFDATLFNAVSLANAFGSPDDSHAALRVANRTSLWIFALDWLIDYRAKARGDVEALVVQCADAVIDGAPAADAPLTRFLTEIRDLLAEVPAFAAHRAVWLDELRRMLDAMALEWEWKAVRTETGAWTPTLDEYLANADNFGSTFVNAGHWIFTSRPSALTHLDPLLEASREVQRVLRLLNDLATYERDVTWGDLNAMLLPDADRATVKERIGELVDHCRKLLRPLHETCPREARYLERQIGYSMGFYGAADYWGEL